TADEKKGEADQAEDAATRATAIGGYERDRDGRARRDHPDQQARGGVAEREAGKRSERGACASERAVVVGCPQEPDQPAERERERERAWCARRKLPRAKEE